MRSTLERLVHWVPRSRWRSTSVARGLVVVIGIADHVTGHELALSLFYLFPVLLITHVLGRTAGFALAGLVACIWTLAQWNDGPSAHGLQIAWNLLMRFGVLAIATHLLLALEIEMRQSRYDFLTNLSNRRHFVSLLEAEQSRSYRHNTPFSVLYLDIDHFKTLNDTLGHAAGDEALQIVAETLRTQSRRMDAPARIGGDEFVMLLPDTDATDCRLIAERIQKSLTSAIDQRRWPIGISIGTTTACGSGQTTEEILRAADQAMYRAKRASMGD